MAKEIPAGEAASGIACSMRIRTNRAGFFPIGLTDEA